MNTRNAQTLASLMILRPETVAAAENLPFMVQARALPGVIDVGSDVMDYVDGIGSNADTEIDVKEEMRLIPDLEGRSILMEKHLIVGGLCNDTDAQNPMDDDGMGQVFRYGRRGSREENTSFYEALGFTSDGSKDYRCDAVENELIANVTTEMRKNRALMATLSGYLRGMGQSGKWDAVCDFVKRAIQQEGYEYALDYVSERLFNVGYWERLDSNLREKLDDLKYMLTDTEADKAWDSAMAKGLLGNPLAVKLDIYEHGGTCYSVSGEGMQCSWDTSRCGAVWVPDSCAEENILHTAMKKLTGATVAYFGACGSEQDPLHTRLSLDGGQSWEGHYSSFKAALQAAKAVCGVDEAQLMAAMQEEAVTYCRSTLESYNDWLAGAVYGVVIYVIDRATGERIEDMDDECWGHIGSSYATETLESAMLALAVDLGKPSH